MTASNEEGVYIAKVTYLSKGEKPYALCRSPSVSGTISFSLDPDHHVWEEKELPRIGTSVVLIDVRNEERGWRAYHARFMRPDDETTQQPK